MAADWTAHESLAGDTVVSHGTAAELWGIGDLWSGGIHFTVQERRQSRQSDVHFHRAELQEGDWIILQGLPVTTVARTIADLAREGHEADHLLTLVADASEKRLVKKGELLDHLDGQAEAFGVSDRAALQELIAEYFPQPERSNAEWERIVEVLDARMQPLEEKISSVMDVLRSSCPSCPSFSFDPGATIFTTSR